MTQPPPKDRSSREPSLESALEIAPQSETSRFIDLARSLGFLEDDSVATLLEEAAREQTPPMRYAVQSGFLSVTQVDVIETLLRPGDQIPGYDVLDFLGQGGMGVVFRARQKALRRVVALKTVLVSQLGSPAAAARFEQEALTVARLQHPHIVAAYDFGRHGGRLYFAMELVEGEDVERLIERSGPLDEATAWGLARQAAAGLAHASGAGVVHRDIKPANLLLVEPPAGFPLPPGLPLLKIADFGLAFLAAEAESRTRLTGVNTALGSPHYMAPEQIDQADIDHRADIYALGAAVYHMLGGRPPFAGGALSKILSEKMTRGPRPLRELAPAVSLDSAALVESMMARAASERPSDYGWLIARMDDLTRRPPRGPAASAGATSYRLPDDSGVKTAAASSRTPQSFGTLPTQLIAPTDKENPSSDESIAAAPPPTDELTVVALPGRRAPSWKVVAGLAAGVFLAAVASSFLLGSNRARPATLELSGRGEALFDGVTIRGWLPSGGAWQAAKDDDGAGVIAGTNGTLRRSLPVWVDDQERPTPFRVTLFAHPRQAKSVDILFAVESKPDAGPRGVLRLAEGHAVLGTESAGENGFRPHSPKMPLAASASGVHVVRVERQADRWWIWIDDRALGSLPAPGGGQRATLALRVAGDTAWFSDIQLEELTPPAQ